LNEKPLRLAAGTLLVIAGAIWVLQGLNVAFAPQSFMSDDRRWVLWGIIAIGLGLLLIWRSKRS